MRAATRLLRRLIPGRKPSLPSESPEAELRRLRAKLNRRIALAAADAPHEHLRLEYEGAEIRMVASSGKRVRASAKEPFTVHWLESLVGQGDVLYDVGANVGAYSLIAAARHPELAVYAFEPGFASYAALCENIVLNGFSSRIMPVPIPLAGETRRDVFRYSSILAGSANHNQDGDAPAYEQPVLTYRLDDLVRHFALPLPSHVKLDVDGAELAVLTGFGDVLRAPELRSVLVELPSEGDDGVTQLLTSNGLHLSDRFDRARAGFVSYGLFERG